MAKWLISVEALANRYRQDDQQNKVVIVDCRFSLADTDEGQRLYEQGHIEAAYYLHLDRDLSGVKGKHGGRHPLPEPQSLVQTLQAMGVDKETLVVAYDDHRFAFASRLLWLLRYIGHDNVKVLDGGYRAWCQAGLATSTDYPTAESLGSITANIRSEMVVDINDVKALAHQQYAALIDSREEERYLGVVEPIDPIAGHIDGALNYPWVTVTNDDGQLTDRQQQQQRWGELLTTEQLIVYCGSGVTACVNLLSLAELGREDAKLYAGSWSDWCSYLNA